MDTFLCTLSYVVRIETDRYSCAQKLSSHVRINSIAREAIQTIGILGFGDSYIHLESESKNGTRHRNSFNR